MKKLLVILVVLSLIGCQSAPNNYSYFYDKQNTGLDQLIDLDGYYVSQFGCDSTFFSVFMFYPDGLFTIATASEVSPELIDCFVNGGKSKICQYPLWGVYRLEGDTIKTQVIVTEGSGCTIFRDYKILGQREIVNISDYVEPEKTNLGYFANYPSFMVNSCAVPAMFYPSVKKRNPGECPFIDKKWFNKVR